MKSKGDAVGTRRKVPSNFLSPMPERLYASGRNALRLSPKWIGFLDSEWLLNLRVDVFLSAHGSQQFGILALAPVVKLAAGRVIGETGADGEDAGGDDTAGIPVYDLRCAVL